MNLKLINLEKRFGQKLLFENLSFSFENNGVYAIVGNSGVGKTTLLRMIAGLDTDFSGEIVGGGKSNVSYVFQEYRLFPTATALENVILGNGGKFDIESREKALDLLSYLGFKKEEAELLPSELSGGMKQRVSLARALMKNSDIFLLDEPSKELDQELKEKLYTVIEELSKTKLVIIVTHSENDLLRLNPKKIYL